MPILQLVHPVEPCCATRPAVHERHAILLCANVPLGQMEQVKRPVLRYPALHWVQVPAELPPQPVLMVPSAHAAQDEQLDWPVSDWNT